MRVNPDSHPLFGFLAVDKPAGKSSRRVVDRVCGLIGKKRVGHAGTLDPIATGVLVLALGPATRLIGFAQSAAKAYVGTFRLGVASNSDDVETDCIPVEDCRIPSLDELRGVAKTMVGWTEQTPPTFSAVKVAGRRAYHLARKGKSIDLAPRQVRIDSIEIVSFVYPMVTLAIRCGKGTYIRSVGRDLAAAAGTACVMTELSRVAIGPVGLADCCRFDDLDLATIRRSLLPPATFLPANQRIVCGADQIDSLRRGMAIESPDIGAANLAAVDLDDRLLAVLHRADKPGWWRPSINFVPFWDQVDDGLLR